WADIHDLVVHIVDVMVEQFGAFLLLEIWPVRMNADEEESSQRAVSRPRFRIVTQDHGELGDFLDKFTEALSRIKIDGQTARVELESRSQVAPPGLRPLLSIAEAEQKKCLVVGLEISPIFADFDSEKIFPQVRRSLD